MRSILVILALCSLLPATGQWNGTYNGIVNGDPVRMTLSQNGDAITGQLRDSYQTYDITGSISGDRLEGAATESTTRLQFGLQAKLESETLSGKLVLEAEGAMAEVPFVLTRQGASSDPATGASVPFPPDAQHPTELCGGWTQNESYNSGSGDAFMGANFSQSMAFLPASMTSFRLSRVWSNPWGFLTFSLTQSMSWPWQPSFIRAMLVGSTPNAPAT